ncbi:unnamed protein product [Prunus armeniaca]
MSHGRCRSATQELGAAVSFRANAISSGVAAVIFGMSPVGCRSATQELEDVVGALGADAVTYELPPKLGKLRRPTAVSFGPKANAESFGDVKTSHAPNDERVSKADAESLGGCEDIARAK